MAKKDEKKSAATTSPATSVARPELETIEELAERLAVEDWLFAGLKRAHRWGAGLRMSEKKFRQYVEEFSGAPMGRVQSSRRAG